METNLVTISIQFDEFVKCYSIGVDRFVFDLKQLCLQDVQKEVEDAFNYGIFDVLDGQFLSEDSYISECRFRTLDGTKLKPFLFKYKSRIYKKNELVPKLKQIKSLQNRTNEKKFLDAIHSNNLEKLIKLAAKGFDPNFHCHDFPNETPLSLTSKLKSDISLSKLLTVLVVNCGALLDYRTKDGSTVLHRAVERNNYAAVKTLVDLGAPTNSKNSKNFTPLYLCTTMPIHSIDLNIVKVLLKNNARTGTTDTHGWHEIHQVCRNGFAQMLELLLSHGAVDLNAKNASGNTALHVCAVNGQMECAKLLLNHGCDSDSYNYANQTAYQVAIIANNMNLAEVIDTFRKNDTDSMKNVEVNNVTCGRDIRVVELKRSIRGYGFILRGIKNTDSKLINVNNFPALQYLDSIEKDSVADLAGLKRGDFILMINDTNVAMEKHETVVELIRKSGDSVRLTVIASTENVPSVSEDDSLSAKSLYSATLPRNRIRAPLPPRRNPKTSLTHPSRRPPSMFLTHIEYDDYFMKKVREKFNKYSTGSLPMNWECVFATLLSNKNQDHDKLLKCQKLLHNGFHSDPDLTKECKLKNELQRRKSDDETLKSVFNLIIDKKIAYDEKNICNFLNKNHVKIACNCNAKLKSFATPEMGLLQKSLYSNIENIMNNNTADQRNNDMKVSQSFPVNLSNNAEEHPDDNSSSGISSDQETVLLEGSKDDHCCVPPPPEFKEEAMQCNNLNSIVLEPPPQFCDTKRSKSLSRAHKLY